MTPTAPPWNRPRPTSSSSTKAAGVIPPEEMTPAAFEKMMAERMVKFGDVVKRAGIKAE